MTEAQERVPASEGVAIWQGALLAVSELDSIDTVKDAGRLLADRFRVLLSADGCALGLCRDAPPPRIIGWAGVSDVDRQSRFVDLATKALTEIVSMKSDASLVPTARRAFAEAASAACVEGYCAKCARDGDCPVLLIWWKTERESVREEGALMAAALSAAMPAVRRLGSGRDGAVRRLLRTLPNTPGAWRMLRTAVITLVLGTGLLLPVVPHRIRGEVEFETLRKSIVNAPFDGIISTCSVRAGDLVRMGQVVASLDEEDLSLQLAARQTSHIRAEKTAALHRANGAPAEARIAELEAEAIEREIALLESRLASLQIRSPLTGTVLSQPHEQAEGMAVSMGDPLMEIAPLSNMLAVIAFPIDALGRIRRGGEATLRIAAYPGEKWHGDIAGFRPRAEILEDRNVAVAEVLIGNTENRLMPGMRGKATVDAGQRSILWLIAHRPWEALVGWIREW